MNRKSFISDTILCICASLLPEILRPMDSGCLFDVKRINDRLERLRQNPLEAKDCFSKEPIMSRTLEFSNNRIIYLA